MNLYGIILILIILLSLLFFLSPSSEHFTNPTIQPEPYVKLYERFNQKNLIFDFQPAVEDPGAQYFKDIIKAEIKSIDLNIPLKNDELDDIRKIELWSLYDGDNTSSSESDFYNPFTEPSFARRANSAKYKLIISMSAGNRVKLNLAEPVKKVFVIARF